MKKETARFWKTMLIFTAMIAVIDITVGIVADRLMDKLPDYSGDFAKDNYRLHRLETDVVILGSSRGCYHYVSRQLSDSIDAYLGKHLSLYNAAISAKFANSNSCAAEAIIARYHPQLVIWDISEKQLCNGQVEDIEFSSPFYWKDTIVRRYLDNIGLKERILMKSSLYRYNGKLFRIVSTIFSPEAPNDGYESKRGSKIDLAKYNKEAEVSMPLLELNIYTLNNFENVLKKYSSAGVPLVIVCSPKFRPTDNNKRLAAICEKHGIPFIDFYDTPYFNDHPELIYDANHLNDDGAHVYTALFFEQLKTYLPMP
jgi:hypothetical protein